MTTGRIFHGFHFFQIVSNHYLRKEEYGIKKSVKKSEKRISLIKKKISLSMLIAREREEFQQLKSSKRTQKSVSLSLSDKRML